MKHIISQKLLDGIFIEQVRRDQEFSMSHKHVHSEYEIYYLLEGSRNYFIGNQTYHVQKGNLVVVNRYQMHKTSSTGQPAHTRYLIEFIDESFSGFFNALCNISLADFFSQNQGILELNKAEQRKVESILSALTEDAASTEALHEVSFKMRLCELLIMIIRCRSKDRQFSQAKAVDTPKHQKVHEVASFIEERYMQPLSLEDLSSHFYINKSYLSRIFKEVTGFTTSEYINVLRIKTAQKLLVESNLSINQIAHSLGYESRTYFERVFRNHTETSPLRFRKRQQLAAGKTREKIAEHAT